MGLDFKEYKLLNIEDLIVNEKDKDKDKYKLKKLYRKNKEVQIFSKRAFNKYTDEHEVQIVGRIRKRQHHYEDYADYNELVKEKRKKKIISSAELAIDCNKTEPDFKKYDVKKDKSRFTYGYAWIGNNKFLRVTRFNLLLLLIPLLIILGILLGLYFYPNDNPEQTPPTADQQPYTDSVSSEPDPNNNFAIVLKREYYVSADNPTIELKNYTKNVKDISYDVFTEDGTYIGSTGLIEPGNKADLNIYSVLNFPGEYRLRINATSYNDNGSKNPIDGNIVTTVIVE